MSFTRTGGRGSCWPILGLCVGGFAVLWLTFGYLLHPDASLADTARSIASYAHRTPGQSNAPAAAAVEQSAAPTQPSCQVNQTYLERYGRHTLKLSRVHEGTGYRVQQVLRRLEQGEQVKMAVIGGSVSNGHGMLDGRPYVYHAYPDTWHTFVSSWLNETYGPQAYINGAMAATQSSVFRFCWTERVALEEQAPDLVFIELDVNDVLDDESREASEALVRSIMHLPNKPAVLFVGSFALKPQNTKDGQLSGMDAHSPVAAYYDVPQISLRGAFTPALLQDRTLADPYFNGDARHIAPPLHKALGELIITYLEEQRCEVIDPPEDPFVPSDIVPAPTFLGEVPKRLMQERWDTKGSHPHAPPTCRIAGSTLEPATPSPGWASFSFMHAKYYLEAKQADQTVEFDVEIPEGGVGQIGVGYLRSPKYKLGRVICHVGDQEKTLNGQWERSSSLTVIDIVAEGLTPGRHRLSCTTRPNPGKGRTNFRLAAVVSA